jgi:hypothetical protein
MISNPIINRFRPGIRNIPFPFSSVGAIIGRMGLESKGRVSI